ncbi:unnamed protein product [Symbiodinium sp. KB8]|nr:unnamed protein product [Symbiodinium sp. KB8]
MPAGPISPAALPLRDLEPRAATLKHFFDIVYDFDGRIVNYDQLGPILRDQSWGELPAPFGLKKPLDVKYVMQIFIRAQKNGKNCIVKHIFMPDDKVKASLLHDCGYGTLYEVVWGTHAKTTNKALQFMLEQMGGVQYRLFMLTPEQKKKAKVPQEKSDEELEKGFQYIREYGERDKGNLKQLQWIQRNIAGNTPIKGWKDGLVQRCLDSLANDATMADLITRSDLVISDFEEEIQQLFFKIVPYLREHAIWILGEPGKGKTRLGHDVQSFPRRGTNPVVSHKDFVKMIRPALGDMSPVDTMAIFKRSVFFLITKTSVYWRLPGPIEKDVNRKSWLLPDLIKESAKPIIANFKRKGPPPADQEGRLLWKDAWLLEAIRQHDHPDQIAVQVPVPNAVSIKRERVAFARALSSESRAAPIDLDSPSRKKKARADVPNPPDADDDLADVPEDYAQDELERDLELLVDEEKENDEMDVDEANDES